MKDLEVVLLKLLKEDSFCDKNIKCLSHRLAGVGRFRNCIIKTVKMKQLQQQDELIQSAFKTYVSLSFF